MGQGFPSLTSPPLGTPAHQQPLTLSLSCLDSVYSLSPLLSVVLIFPAEDDPWFPSLALTGSLISPPCLSLGLLLGTILRGNLPSLFPSLRLLKPLLSPTCATLPASLQACVG